MKKYIAIVLLSGAFLASCGEYNKVIKSTDYINKYEAAKSYFGQGEYMKASTLLEELVAFLKGSDNAEESLYMLAMCYYNQGDYVSASHYFTNYYNTYPKGVYTELARFHSGKALYLDTPEARLDQSSTYSAIQELQMFMEYFPRSERKSEAQIMIFALQDKLVEKEYLSAKLYFDLGSYTMNCAYGGSNYEACVVTAQNALRDFPFAKPERREELSVMILRARFLLAEQSIDSKRVSRYRDCIDEYYAFVNDFPESKYIKEAEKIMSKSTDFVNKHASKDEVVD